MNHTEYMRQWRAKNKEKNREYQREYHKVYSADPENQAKARRRALEWNKQHAEEKRVYNRARSRAKPKRGRPIGAAHHNWKGENVGYHALHIWLARVRGRPALCEHCGTTTAKRYEWANIDHRYRRSLEDYIRLCTSCHRNYDHKHNLVRPS